MVTSCEMASQEGEFKIRATRVIPVFGPAGRDQA